MRISLTALRAFEATARLGSMSQAAAELRVGLASVSRHLSALQARLKVELLRREGRGVVLTPTGRAYFAEITAAFSSIVAATEGLAEVSGPRLTIAAEPCLAQRWLLPRLRRFREMEPGLAVRLLAAGPDIAADVTLSWRRDLDRLETGMSVLVEPRIVALAAADATELPSLAALMRGATLVHQRSTELWQRWLVLAGGSGEPARAGVVVPDKAWALSAAAGGVGLALACQVLAKGEIEAGRCRLVLGAGHHMGGYVVERGARPAGDPALAARFIDWVAAELRQATA